MPTPPEGTITFLFTDIAGSSSRYEQYREAMSAAVACHDAILREASESHGGYPFKTWGDAFFVAFPTAPLAVAAALEAQQALIGAEEAAAVGGLPVRMVLHTGDAELRNGDYFGDALNRTDRLLKITNGGQILLTGSAADLAENGLPEGCTLIDLGLHRLRDLQRAEKVYQLCHPDLPSEFPPLRSLGYLPTNLPQQLTSFIGREREIEHVKTLLSETRLLTLTGSGGCGKTRLALQVAAEVLDEYPDGVWLVELAALREPELVSRTVGAALGLSEEPGKDGATSLSEFLRNRELLLILDNCEHLVDSVASLTERLLRECPNLRVLATSREGLAVAGEMVWRVPSLLVPKVRGKVTADLDAALDSEAVRLFVDRARSVSPGFQLSPSGAVATVEICRKLDGIPLAIELAAARVNVLSPEQIGEQLVDFFRILTGGRRTALPRQKTLFGTIQWSYDLLTEPQRILFRRLSVFQGGWTLEAAEDVCDGEGVESKDVLDLLTGLVEKSLVVVDEGTGAAPRFRFLETVRQFGLERTVLQGEADVLRDRHLEYFLALAEEAEPQLQTSNQRKWLDALEADHDNLRAALAACTVSTDRLRLSGALWRFWYVRGHWFEGRSWLGRAMLDVRNASDSVVAKAANGAGVLAWAQHDYPAAETIHNYCLGLRRGIGDRAGIAGSLSNLGMLAHQKGEIAAARQYYSESHTIYREIGNDPGMAMVLSNLGNLALEEAMYEEARNLYAQSLSIYRSCGDDWGIAAVLHNLGESYFVEEDYVAARRAFKDALTIERRLCDPSSIANTVWHLCQINARVNAFEQAAMQLGCVERTWAKLGENTRADTVRKLSEYAALLISALSENRFQRLYGAGEQLSIEDLADSILHQI